MHSIYIRMYSGTGTQKFQSGHKNFDPKFRFSRCNSYAIYRRFGIGDAGRYIRQNGRFLLEGLMSV